MSDLDHEVARAALFDPTTPADDLARIVASWPDLWSLVLDHPSVSPELAAWIRDQPPLITSTQGETPTTIVEEPDLPADDISPAAPPRRRRRAWIVVALVVVAGLVTWFVVVPRLGVSGQPHWRDPVPGTAGADWAWFLGPDRLVVTNPAQGVAQLVDVAANEVVAEVPMDAAMSLVAAAADSTTHDGRPGFAIAYGRRTTPDTTTPWTVALSRTGRAFDETVTLDVVGGVEFMAWLGDTLVLADGSRTIALASDTLVQLWAADRLNGLIGTRAVSTPSGVVNVADGRPAPFGQSASLRSCISPQECAMADFMGTDRHVVRLIGPTMTVTNDGTATRFTVTGPTDVYTTIQGWDTAADDPAWSSALWAGAHVSWAWDPTRGDDVLLTMMAAVPPTSAYVSGVSAFEPGQTFLDAYSPGDGSPLWQTPLPIEQESLCFPLATRDYGTQSVDAGAGVVAYHCVPSDPTSGGSVMTYLIDVATGEIALAVPGEPWGEDDTGAFFIGSPDDNTILGYARSGGTWTPVWSVPFLTSAGAGDGSAPSAKAGPVDGPAQMIAAGPWLVALPEAGVRILR